MNSWDVTIETQGATETINVSAGSYSDAVFEAQKHRRFITGLSSVVSAVKVEPEKFFEPVKLPRTGGWKLW